VAVTADGSYIVAGYKQSNPAWGAGVWKLDAQGRVMWEQTYGRAGRAGLPYAQAIAVTADGGYVIAGVILVNDPREPKTVRTHSVLIYAWILKLDAQGRVMWERTLGDKMDVKAVAVTADGGYIVAGEAWGLKLDRDGQINGVAITK